MIIACLGATTSQVVAHVLREHKTLVRTNYAKRQVTLAGGWALATGLSVVQLASGQPRALIAMVPASVLGAVDDSKSDTRHKGLRGHLRALTRGEVTTGAAKLVGIGAAAVLTAATARRTWIDTALDATILAAGANVANLFDL
ncbi:MAG: hypothetical protein Q4Q03_05650, partial [Bowdeniella nasicola]|nr:hypothetical protein [Bowdeniella nasicola]